MFIRLINLAIAILLSFSTESLAIDLNKSLTASQLQKLLDSKKRYKGDSLRDVDRKPAKILKFADIAQGDVVLDLYAGGGWYTELFSMAVGKDGLVYAHNDHLTWRFGGRELEARTKGHRLPNVVRLDEVGFDEMDVPNQSVDIAFMGINYHDLFFVDRIRKGKYERMREDVVDHQEALESIRNKLKSDGILIIIDHFAEPGSGYRAANDLHRIDPNIVKHQLDAAGFELQEEAFYLRNPNDDLSKLVFDPSIRGKTSRFIYKFGKR